jgi:hypothetical protein
MQKQIQSKKAKTSFLIFSYSHSKQEICINSDRRTYRLKINSQSSAQSLVSEGGKLTSGFTPKHI